MYPGHQYIVDFLIVPSESWVFNRPCPATCSKSQWCSNYQPVKYGCVKAHNKTKQAVAHSNHRHGHVTACVICRQHSWRNILHNRKRLSLSSKVQIVSTLLSVWLLSWLCVSVRIRPESTGDAMPCRSAIMLRKVLLITLWLLRSILPSDALATDSAKLVNRWNCCASFNRIFQCLET